jgi:hypothetical protein
MKGICRLFISLVVVGFALALLVFAQRQPQKPTSEKVGPNSGNLGNQEVAKKKGKNIVKELPNGAEGVTLEEGKIKLKPGYKFVKGKNDKVSVNLMRGGGGASVGGDWSCECSSLDKTNDCKASIQSGILTCISGASCTACDLSVTVGKLKQAIVAY